MSCHGVRFSRAKLKPDRKMLIQNRLFFFFFFFTCMVTVECVSGIIESIYWHWLLCLVHLLRLKQRQALLKANYLHLATNKCL